MNATNGRLRIDLAGSVAGLVASAAFACSSAAAVPVLYVDADAPPGGDGLSWATAFRNPHQAHQVANPAGEGAAVLTQIWVAEGTYKPTLVLGGDPEETSFFLAKRLEYLGGFSGTETSADQRDPAIHETILSGDVGVPGVATDNSRRVVRTGFGADATAVLDGFTITGGYADIDLERGGGLFCEAATPTVRNCLFVNNFATRNGGAVYTNSPATFINCSFINNSVTLERGGGIGSDSNAITVRDCHFEGNHAVVGGGLYGGGLVENCVFLDNTASASGGGAYFVGTIRGCIFIDNAASFSGGGGFETNANVPLLVSKCLFMNNTSGGGRGGGAKVGSDTVQATFANCIFLGNSSNVEGGGLYTSAAVSTAITNCLFSGNSASLGGGVGGSVANFRNCSIGYNSATSSSGGGVWTGGVSSVRNSILWGNTASSGSGYSAQNGMVTGSTIQWSCIQGWTSGIGGAGNTGADPLWLNPIGPDLDAGTDDDNLRLATGSPCIDGAQNSSVPVDSLDLDGDGNTAEPTPIDLDGDPRFFDDVKTADHGSGTAPVVDMGAYEFDGERPKVTPGTYTGPPGGSWFNPTNWAGGTLPDADTDVTIEAAVVIAQPGALAATVTLLAGGALSVQGGSLECGAMTVAAGATLSLGGASAMVEVDILSVQTGASLQWSAGTIQIHQSFSSAPAITVGCRGAALLQLLGSPVVTAPSLTICSQGEVRGTGTIAASLVNSGLLVPGAPVGTLTINGQYAQNRTGELAFAIGGYEAGRDSSTLSVVGQATLDGLLTVVGLPGFPFELAGLNQLIAAASLSGQFDVVDLPGLPGLFEFQVTTTSTSLGLITTLGTTGRRLYVDRDAAPGGDGQSWAGAVRELQGALTVEATHPGLVDEIWVAAGTYKPTLPVNPTDPRSATFVVPDGVELRGGFAGDETAPGQADPAAHPTVLSGDLLGNDARDLILLNPTVQDNCYHVLVTSGTETGTLIDGFTIANGNASLPPADNRGGGVLNLGGHPTFADCAFATNRAWQTGGAIHSEAGALTLERCTFEENVIYGVAGVGITGGGGLFSSNDVVDLVQCTINSNYSLGIGSTAGPKGVHCIGSEVNATECMFSAHTGHAARLDGTSGTWSDCTFDGNVDGQRAALTLAGGSMTFSLCEFTNNMSTLVDPAALSVGGGSNSFVDCVFSGNTSASATGGAVRVGNSDSQDIVAFTDCLFTGNTGGSGGAVSNAGYNVLYTGCTFSGNIAIQNGGAVNCTAFASVKLVDCTITGNLAQGHGGGVHQDNNANLTFVNTSVSANISPGAVGIYNRSGSIFGVVTTDQGNGLFNARVLAPGFLPPGAPTAIVDIDGDYHHAIATEPFEGAPMLILDVGGTVPGTGHDAVHVDGNAQIDGGTLILNFLAGFSPQIGQTFDVLTASAVTGQFDGVGVAGMPPGFSVELTYLSDRVRVSVVEGRVPVFTDPLATVVIGFPKDAVLFDLENDGFLELAMPMDVSGGSSTMYVLQNGGLNDRREWLGFADQPIAVDVGDTPKDIAAADLDGDQFQDLIVVRDGIIDVVRNFGGTLLLPTQLLFTTGGPSDIVIGPLVGSASPDFAVPLFVSGQIRIFRNLGDATFAPDSFLAAGPVPTHLALADVDLDGDDDLVAANTSDFFGQPKLSVHLRGAAGFAPAVFYPIGRQTTGLVVAPFNDDELPDVIVSNRLDQNLSVLMANSASAGTYLPAFNVPVGGDPFDMTSLDFDADGDRDLVLIVKPPGVGPVVRPIRNDIGLDGRSTFVVMPDLATDDIPSLVYAGDVDADGDEDLIFAEAVQSGIAGPAAPQSRIVIRLNESGGLPADLNHDGHVNGIDLAMMLAQWGLCSVGGACTADLDGNGVVNGIDLAMLLAAWS